MDLHYGEPWRRLAAAVVDAVVVGVPVGVAAAIMVGRVPPGQIAADLIIFGSGLIMFYKILSEGSRRKATLGKMWLDLKVTGMDGRQLSYAACALRSWPLWLPGAMVGVTGQLLSVLVFLSIVALGLIPFNARRQGLHDMMARTLVVRRHEFPETPPKEEPGADDSGHG